MDPIVKTLFGSVTLLKNWEDEVLGHGGPAQAEVMPFSKIILEPQT
jgi:hypothetical protein